MPAVQGMAPDEQMLTRCVSVGLAEEDLSCLKQHVFSLIDLSERGALPEWAEGIDQLRLAIERVSSDVAASKAARIQ